MTILTTKSISAPGIKTKPNEDGIIIKDNLYVVLDGATGLGEKKINKSNSDAQWLVNVICDYFNENWAPRKQFISTLKKAVVKAKKDFKTITNLTDNLKPFELPSAGLVAIHLFKNHMRAYRIGDCSLFIKEGDTITDIFGDTPLHALDDISIIKLNKALKRGLSYDEAREDIKDILKKNRSKMNTKGGYAVLSIDPNSINGLEEKRISLVHDTNLFLSSDGFSALHEKYEYSLDDIFQELSKTSLEKIINKLRKIEYDDEDLLKFPRLKPHDDATCVYLELEKNG